MAGKLGELRTTYQAWEAGRTAIPPGVQAKLKKLGYDGPWPQDETKSPAQGDYITREEFAEYRGATAQRIQDLRDNLEDTCEVVRFLLTLVPPESRPGAISKRFR